MKKVKVLLIPIIVMFLFVGCIFAYKWYLGTKIVHYKQFMYLCQGQMTEPMNGIPFYFIDEEKLSEMADINNIKKVYVTTDTGEKIQAERWELEELYAINTPENYVERKLQLWLPYEEEYTITQLTIVYPDAKETFEAGSLKVIPIEQDAFLRMNIEGRAWELQERSKFFTDPNYVPEPEPEPLDQETLQPKRNNFFSAVGQFYSSGGPFTITKIDFGIEGMGIDPSTIRFLQGEESGAIGEMYAFADKEENKIYLESDVVEELPPQDISISVTEEAFSIYSSIRLTEEYHPEWSCIYISPVYHCVDDVTGEPFLYGSEMNHEFYIPILRYEEEYTYIINEKGV